MDLGTAKVRPLVDKVRSMVREQIIPLEEECHGEIGRGGNRPSYTGRQEEKSEGLKQTAKDNLILGRGRGFEVSQRRLGLGRITSACGRSASRSTRSNCSAGARRRARRSASTYLTSSPA